MSRDKRISRIDVVADANRRKLVGEPLKAFEYQAADVAAEDILTEAALTRGALSTPWSLTHEP